MPFKSEKQRRWMHANDPEMAAKWEKKEKMLKKEMKIKELIKKLVREIMQEKKLTEAIDTKKHKKDLNESVKIVRKNNFEIARSLNKVNKTKAKQVMSLYKRYIIEYQIRVDKLLRD